MFVLDAVLVDVLVRDADGVDVRLLEGVPDFVAVRDADGVPVRLTDVVLLRDDDGVVL